LLSEYVLEHREYHIGWSDEMANRLPEEMDAGFSTTWADCDLRAYLNGEFLNRFSQSDRERIAETYIINSDNPWIFSWSKPPHTPGGSDTIDKIFLLSIDEVLRYFGDSGQLANQPSANSEIWWGIYDEYNGGRVAHCLATCPYNDYHNDGGYGLAPWWWLRSPGSISFIAAFVVDDGSLSVAGDKVYAWYGVRPALWLNL
jgi:hypothetical protein